MKKILLAVCSLLMASVAAAQTTAVQATVTDPKGVPYAYGTVKVSLTASGTEYLNGAAYTPPPVSSLDSFGRFTLQLADNNILQPAGSSYSFLICSSTNGIVPPFSATPTCFSVAGIKATGTVNNLTSTLSASATDLNVGGVSSWSQIQALLTGSCGPTTAVFGDGSCQVPAGGGNVSNSGTPTSGQLGIWTSATQLSGATASQDCTVSSLGVFTCTKTNNVAFAASATTDATNATNITSGTLNASRLPTLVAGSDTQVQFNDAGTFGADSTLTFNKTTKVLSANAFSGTGNAFSGTEAVTSTISCALGLDVLWASSSSHSWQVCNNNGSSGSVFGATLANAIAAGGSLDMSAATGVAAFKVPVQAGYAPTASGAVGYDSTANNWEVGKNGTTFTVCTTASEAGCGGSGNVSNNAANTFTSSGTLNLSASSATAGLRLPNAAGAAPLTAGVAAYDTTQNSMVCGNGTTTTHCVVYPLIGGGAAGTVPSGATSYTVLVGSSALNAAENIRQEQLPFSGSISNLCVTSTTTQPASGSLVIVLHDATTNSAVTGITITIAANTVAGTYCDNTNTSSVTARHDYAWRFTNNATATSAAFDGIGAVYSY